MQFNSLDIFHVPISHAFSKLIHFFPAKEQLVLALLIIFPSFASSWIKFLFVFPPWLPWVNEFNIFVIQSIYFIFSFRKSFICRLFSLTAPTFHMLLISAIYVCAVKHTSLGADSWFFCLSTLWRKSSDTLIAQEWQWCDSHLFIGCYLAPILIPAHTTTMGVHSAYIFPHIIMDVNGFNFTFNGWWLGSLSSRWGCVGNSRVMCKYRYSSLRAKDRNGERRKGKMRYEKRGEEMCEKEEGREI